MKIARSSHCVGYALFTLLLGMPPTRGAASPAEPPEGQSAGTSSWKADEMPVYSDPDDHAMPACFRGSRTPRTVPKLCQNGRLGMILREWREYGGARAINKVQVKAAEYAALSKRFATNGPAHALAKPLECAVCPRFRRQNQTATGAMNDFGNGPDALGQGLGLVRSSIVDN